MLKQTLIAMSEEASIIPFILVKKAHHDLSIVIKEQETTTTKFDCRG